MAIPAVPRLPRSIVVGREAPPKIMQLSPALYLASPAASPPKTPTVIDYVNRYRAADQRIPAGLRVRFLDYDKRLNRQHAPG